MMEATAKTPSGVTAVLVPEELNRRMETRDTSRYEKREDGKLYCKECGSVILGAKVAHPIWDGPFPMSGSGKCFYEEVPYCPKCEEKPSFHGEPIVPKGSHHNP